MRRALVIAPNWIGDALMAQPLFSLLKKLHPRIVIDAVAPAWVAPVLERMPEIHDVYATDLAHGKLQLLRRWQLASDLRDEALRALDLPDLRPVSQVRFSSSADSVAFPVV